jgi:hypothetical protein
MVSTYPHLNTTLVVTVAVGLITYLVVMNLRTLVLIIKIYLEEDCRALPQTWKSKLKLGPTP